MPPDTLRPFAIVEEAVVPEMLRKVPLMPPKVEVPVVLVMVVGRAKVAEPFLSKARAATVEVARAFEEVAR